MLTRDGFTLVETLFVLFIICMTSLLTMTFHPLTKSEQNILNEMTTFLYEAKLEAMVSKQTTTLTFSKDEIAYSSGDIDKRYELPKNSYFESYHFTYNEQGNIKGAKTLTFHYQDHLYQFVFQVGSGSFYVQ